MYLPLRIRSSMWNVQLSPASDSVSRDGLSTHTVSKSGSSCGRRWNGAECPQCSQALGPRNHTMLRASCFHSYEWGENYARRRREWEFIGKEDSPTDGTPALSLFHPSLFLKELLSHLPPERLHPSKKLNSIDRRDESDLGPVTLHFMDGTTHACDILIGADGMNSIVRKSILGRENVAGAPRNTGTWASMAQKTGLEGRKFFDTTEANYEVA